MRTLTLAVLALALLAASFAEDQTKFEDQEEHAETVGLLADELDVEVDDTSDEMAESLKSSSGRGSTKCAAEVSTLVTTIKDDDAARAKELELLQKVRGLLKKLEAVKPGSKEEAETSAAAEALLGTVDVEIDTSRTHKEISGRGGIFAKLQQLQAKLVSSATSQRAELTAEKKRCGAICRNRKASLRQKLRHRRSQSQKIRKAQRKLSDRAAKAKGRAEELKKIWVATKAREAKRSGKIQREIDLIHELMKKTEELEKAQSTNSTSDLQTQVLVKPDELKHLLSASTNPEIQEVIHEMAKPVSETSQITKLLKDLEKKLQRELRRSRARVRNGARRVAKNNRRRRALARANKTLKMASRRVRQAVRAARRNVHAAMKNCAAVKNAKVAAMSAPSNVNLCARIRCKQGSFCRRGKCVTKTPRCGKHHKPVFNMKTRRWRCVSVKPAVVKCRPGYKLIKEGSLSRCVRVQKKLSCPRGASGVMGKCVCVNQHFIFSPRFKRCICKPGFRAIAGGKKCIKRRRKDSAEEADAEEATAADEDDSADESNEEEQDDAASEEEGEAASQDEEASEGNDEDEEASEGNDEDESQDDDAAEDKSVEVGQPGKLYSRKPICPKGFEARPVGKMFGCEPNSKAVTPKSMESLIKSAEATDEEAGEDEAEETDDEDEDEDLDEDEIEE